jgi:hypothetical protein
MSSVQLHGTIYGAEGTRLAPCIYELRRCTKFSGLAELPRSKFWTAHGAQGTWQVQCERLERSAWFSGHKMFLAMI